MAWRSFGDQAKEMVNRLRCSDPLGRDALDVCTPICPQLSLEFRYIRNIRKIPLV
ncbi:Hypothetical protein CAP_1868 [Chondromyces apiculatus DSM 436]|uniref:Uncharacterized protein n=1 Tax=Chondromyces apiculatus DSM 436 TaxID=1192034 RepID=A0A017SSN0_9BACT|nr:Hypothetical protein CAP_1868 [Chondromyces apiculatus DSM 436]